MRDSILESIGVRVDYFDISNDFNNFNLMATGETRVGT